MMSAGPKKHSYCAAANGSGSRSVGSDGTHALLLPTTTPSPSPPAGATPIRAHV